MASAPLDVKAAQTTPGDAAISFFCLGTVDCDDTGKTNTLPTQLLSVIEAARLPGEKIKGRVSQLRNCLRTLGRSKQNKHKRTTQPM